MKNTIQYAALMVIAFGYVVYGVVVGHVGLGGRQRWEFYRESEPGAYWLWLGILTLLGLIGIAGLMDSIRKSRNK